MSATHSWFGWVALKPADPGVPQGRPPGPRTPSLLRRRAIARGLSRWLTRIKMRHTTASSSLIRRPPRIGSPRRVGMVHDLVAAAEPARRVTLFNPPLQPPAGLVGEVLQEQGVHRALEADMLRIASSVATLLRVCC